MQKGAQEFIDEQLLEINPLYKLKIIYTHYPTKRSPSTGKYLYIEKKQEEFTTELYQALHSFNPHVVYAHLGVSTNLLLHVLKDLRNEIKTLIVDEFSGLFYSATYASQCFGIDYTIAENDKSIQKRCEEEVHKIVKEIGSFIHFSYDSTFKNLFIEIFEDNILFPEH